MRVRPGDLAVSHHEHSLLFSFTSIKEIMLAQPLSRQNRWCIRLGDLAASTGRLKSRNEKNCPCEPTSHNGLKRNSNPVANYPPARQRAGEISRSSKAPASRSHSIRFALNHATALDTVL